MLLFTCGFHGLCTYRIAQGDAGTWILRGDHWGLRACFGVRVSCGYTSCMCGSTNHPPKDLFGLHSCNMQEMKSTPPHPLARSLPQPYILDSGCATGYRYDRSFFAAEVWTALHVFQETDVPATCLKSLRGCRGGGVSPKSPEKYATNL